jgi:hypothetical protein
VFSPETAVRPFVAGDPPVMALKALAENAAALSTEDQIHMHFALARAYLQLEDFLRKIAGDIQSPLWHAA